MLTRKLSKSRQAGLAKASRGCRAREPASPAGYAAFGCKDVLTPVGFGRLRGADCGCRIGERTISHQPHARDMARTADCEVLRTTPNVLHASCRLWPEPHERQGLSLDKSQLLSQPGHSAFQRNAVPQGRGTCGVTRDDALQHGATRSGRRRQRARQINSGA